MPYRPAGAPGLGGTVPAADVGISWGKGIEAQGKPWEAAVQKQLPAGTIDLNLMKENFSTFDHLTPEGVAVSSKTLDTSAKTYTQNPSQITSTLNGYVDEMVGFLRDGREGSFVLSNADISGKQMQLAIPSNASAAQLTAIAKSIEYARSQGVEIVVTKVKKS